MNTLIADFSQCPAFHLDELPNWLALAIGLLIIVGFDAWLFRLFRRGLPRTYLIVLELAVIALWLFGLQLPMIVCLMALLAGLMFFFVANRNESRDLVANNMKGTRKWRAGRKNAAEVLFDREAVYSKISEAVLKMSEERVGALITIEKKDSLQEFCRNGTKVNAPVSAELLETIFYKGTRLHDGAVIISNDMIVAAAVSFLPTTRPLPGKFGLRHRAAIGVSESVDCVTVVVSEETGRISIAYQGDLETVLPEDFYSRLCEYMSMARTDNKNED